MSPEDLRTHVVATARALLHTGLVAGTSGNVSVREGDVFHITPSALPYDQVEPEDVATLTIAGEPVAGTRPPSSERRVHQVLYAARPDALAVVHSHSVHATAWSFLCEPLALDTEELVHFAGGEVRCAQYAPAGGDELADAVVAAMDGRRAVLMERHGVVAIGATCAEALDVCAVVERQAQVAWLLRGAGVLPGGG